MADSASGGPPIHPGGHPPSSDDDADTWVVDDESTRGFVALLSIRPRRLGRAAWLLAQVLDLIHGIAVFGALSSSMAVLAVACQYDPTDDVDDQTAHEMATHWRGGLILTAVFAVVAALALLALLRECRWAGSRIDPVAARLALMPTPKETPRVTRREVKNRDRRQNRQLAVGLPGAALLAGIAVLAVLGEPIWGPGLDPLTLFGRVLAALFIGAVTLASLIAVPMLAVLLLVLVRLTASPGRRAALTRLLGGRVISPSEVVARTSVDAATGTSASLLLPGPDPAFLAYLAGPPRIHRLLPGRRVPSGETGRPVAARQLSGWMVSFSLWSLADQGVIRLFATRQGLLRRRRISIERIRPGWSRGSVVGLVTRVPTDDLDAYVDEDTLHRIGPLGELRTLISGWPELQVDDPDWALCATTFDLAVTQGLGVRGPHDSYKFTPGTLAPLRDEAALGRDAYERFETQRPVLAAVLAREGRKAVRAARSSDLEPPVGIRAAVMFAWGTLENWSRRRRRPWPQIPAQARRTGDEDGQDGRSQLNT